MKSLYVPLLFAMLALSPTQQVYARSGGSYGHHSSSHSSSSGYRHSSAPVHVRGYMKKNGTYVAPHYRSHPDKSYNNNWSVKGNVNPFTGKPGTKKPTPDDKPPKASSPPPTK